MLFYARPSSAVSPIGLFSSSRRRPLWPLLMGFPAPTELKGAPVVVVVVAAAGFGYGGQRVSVVLRRQLKPQGEKKPGTDSAPPVNPASAEVRADDGLV